MAVLLQIYYQPLAQISYQPPAQAGGEAASVPRLAPGAGKN
jgi:hypothetical protein